MKFEAFVRFKDKTELTYAYPENISGLTGSIFTAPVQELKWLPDNMGITPGSVGWNLYQADIKKASLAIMPRSDFRTGSLDIDFFTRQFLSDGLTEHPKGYVAYKEATFHNLSYEKVKTGITIGIRKDAEECTLELSTLRIQQMFPNVTADKVNEFEKALENNVGVQFLENAKIQIETAVERMKCAVIQGLIITEWEEYKTHLPVFLQLNKEYIKPAKLFEALGLDLIETCTKYIMQASEGKFSSEKMMHDLINQTKLVGADKLNKAMSYDPKEIDRILRTLKIHDAVMNDVPKQQNSITKRYLLEHLHKDSFEIYLKVLKELYGKIKGKSEFSNEEMYEFFHQHPPLLETPYNKLRNDVSHRLFTVYDDYSDDDLHREANVILVKALTGIIAKHIFLTNIYEQSLPNVLLGLQRTSPI